MKRLHKCIVLLLALFVAGAFVACSGSGSSGKQAPVYLGMEITADTSFLFRVTSFSAEASYEGLGFNSIDGGSAYEVYRNGNITEENLVIPSEYNGKPVTKIVSNGFKQLQHTVTITVPPSIVWIGDNTFFDNPKLTTIILERPSSMGITEIKPSAFQNQTKLSAILVPDSDSVGAYKQAANGWYASIIMLNPNAGGSVDGDTSDKNDNIDQENPFEEDNGSDSGGDNGGGEAENPTPPPTIEEEISSTLEVVTSDSIEYYAEQNEDIYIIIKLLNPDNYVILSFTLGGEHYQSYMFEDGSDNENIVLKRNVGNVSGIIDYTIDAIKYVDGTAIKDVLMNGDKTVKAGIKTSNQVVAQITDEEIGLNSVSFSATITDSDSLIVSADGYAKVVLFDGEEIIAERALNVGSNNVSFGSLSSNKKYQYAVFAYYDNLGGNPSGSTVNLLTKKAFYTRTLVLFDTDGLEVTKDSISFSFSWDDSAVQKSIKWVDLYKGTEKIERLAGNTANGLLSGNEYTLVAAFDDGGSEKTISINATTSTWAIPSIDIIDVATSATSIDFDLDFVDTDSICSVTKVSLNDVDFDGATRRFTGLLSDTEYSINVTFAYDLRDGEGIREVIVSEPCATVPLLEITQARAISTDSVSIGDLLRISVALNNPSNVMPTHIKIDGTLYPVLGVSTPTLLICEIVVSEQYQGGITTIEIEEIVASYGDKEGIFVFAENNTFDVFINGEISVVGVRAIDQSGNETNVFAYNQDITIEVEFSNPTGYQINAIKTNHGTFSSLSVVDEQTVSFIYNLGIGARLLIIEEFKYTKISQGGSDVGFTKDKAVSDIGCFLTVLQSLDVVEITTAEQLLNMDGYRYYKLMNDIDLSGMQWDNAGDFVGYFDGNNHTISNLSVVTSYENQIVEIGLFKNARGIIKNLNLADVLILVDLTSTIAQGYDAFVGCFAAQSENLLLDSCTISGIISVENKTNGESFVSIFVGQPTNETYFETRECIEDINISST